MKESTNPGSRLTHHQRIELELLHSVLDDDAIPYPWNPYDPAAIAYVDNLEREGVGGELSADEFDSKWSTVSQIAAQLWEAPAASLMATLGQKFGTRIPTQLLQQLAASAQTASQSGLALIDQLVESAQSVLEGWETDDLQVMARPLAMAMRGGQEEILEVTLQSVRPVDWAQLSDIEQARLTLAAARYALGAIAEES
jgi:hypothetical protein